MLLCPAPSPPVLLRHLPSQLYNLLPARACVSERSDTKSASYSIIHADRERRVVGGGRARKQDSYKTGPRLYLISSLLQPPPFLIPPSRRLQHLSAQVRPASICCAALLPLWMEGKKEKGKRAQQSGKSHQEVVRRCRVGAVNPAHVILSFAVKGKSQRNSISASWCNNSLPCVLKVQSQPAQALFPHGHFYIFYNLRLMLSRQTV